jgi:hypothetical protein
MKMFLEHEEQILSELMGESDDLYKNHIKLFNFIAISSKQLDD